MQQLQGTVHVTLLLLFVARCGSTASVTAADTPSPQLPLRIKIQCEPQQPPQLQCSASGESRDDETASAGITSAYKRAAAPSDVEFDETHFNLSAALHALHEDEVPADGALDCPPWLHGTTG